MLYNQEFNMTFKIIMTLFRAQKTKVENKRQSSEKQNRWPA